MSNCSISSAPCILEGNVCHLRYEIMAAESHSATGCVYVVGSDNTALTLGHPDCQTDQTVVSRRRRWMYYKEIDVF